MPQWDMNSSISKAIPKSILDFVRNPRKIAWGGTSEGP